MTEIGVGEVIDLKKGLLDAKRLPGVTNGTWLARVKILDPNKAIPPYIIRRVEGELWSLNFDGRRFVFWKCGSSDHIGDKCKGKDRTFEEVFGGTDSNATKSWAAIVRGQSSLDHNLIARRDAIEKQIKENNEIRAKEKLAAEQERLALEQEKRVAEEASKRAREEALSLANKMGADHATRSEGLSDVSSTPPVSEPMSETDDILLNNVLQETELNIDEVDIAGKTGLSDTASVNENLDGNLGDIESQLADMHGEGLPRACQQVGEGASIGKTLVENEVDENLEILDDGATSEEEGSLEKIFGKGATELVSQLESHVLEEGEVSLDDSSSKRSREEGANGVTLGDQFKEEPPGGKVNLDGGDPKKPKLGEIAEGLIVGSDLVLEQDLAPAAPDPAPQVEGKKTFHLSE